MIDVKKNNDDLWIKYAIVFLFVLAISMNFYAFLNYNKGCASCDMRFENTTSSDGINGVRSYSEDSEYMCAWLKGRSEKQINNTICHECDHYHVNKDPEHFCLSYCEGLN